MKIKKCLIDVIDCLNTDEIISFSCVTVIYKNSRLHSSIFCGIMSANFLVLFPQLPEFLENKLCMHIIYSISFFHFASQCFYIFYKHTLRLQPQMETPFFFGGRCLVRLI